MQKETQTANVAARLVDFVSVTPAGYAGPTQARLLIVRLPQHWTAFCFYRSSSIHHHSQYLTELTSSQYGHPYLGNGRGTARGVWVTVQR